MEQQVAEILNRFEALHNDEALAGMARFGINVECAHGLSIPVLREMAKQYKNDHTLALALWDTGVHEARLLAGFIDDPKQVTEAQLERWGADFDSWDVCDLVCSDLFDRTAWAYQKAFEWSEREEEFVRRAGFVMMAAMAVHDKAAPDERFVPFFEVMLRHARDERNFAKKAVNWALRNVGKRNAHLNALALETAQKMLELDSKAARWIARDAIRELSGEKVRARLGILHQEMS